MQSTYPPAGTSIAGRLPRPLFCRDDDYLTTVTQPDDDLRRALLLTLGLLDTGPEAAFDGLTLAAAAATGCPVAALTLVDGERLWFKSRHGPKSRETLPDRGALFSHALGQPGLFEVPDLIADPRFRDDAAVVGEPGLRYFAGVPVRLEGVAVGTLCVVDTQPRPRLVGQALAALLGLATAADALLAGRRPGADSDARALRRRQELLSRMSHEMRTPLNAVLGFAQLLQLDRTIAGHHQAATWVGQIEKASSELLALVEEMLELARLEAGRRRLAPTRVDLSLALHDALETLMPQAAAKGLELVVEDTGTPAADWAVAADARALRQIVSNLLSNAIAHTPPATPVTLRLRSRARARGVEVADRGGGIAAEDLPRLFQPFEKVGSGPGHGGLGLAVSRQLAESLHGTIEVRSEVGAGSAFTLWLPAAGEDGAAAVRTDETPPPADPA